MVEKTTTKAAASGVVKTVCPYCATGCGMFLHTKNGKIDHITGDPEHPNSQGGLCPKGYFGFNHIADPRRLKHPLIKRNGKFEEVSWDEVLDFLVKKFKENKEKYGPDAFELFSSARANNEDNWAAQKFVRAVMGTNNVDHCARICHSSTVAGLQQTLGTGSMTNTIPEIGKNADVIFIIGSDTAECHPLIANQVIEGQKRGAKLIVVDVRCTSIANKADLFIKTPSGYNIPILNAMMNVIINEKLYKADFVKAHTEGFDQIQKAVKDYTPEAVETLTGIPADQIATAARMYAKADAAMILYAMGITQFTHGVGNVVSVSNLAMITGQVGRPGAGVCPLRGQNNVQGASDLGCAPNAFPQYKEVTIEENAQRYEKAWGVKLPRHRGFRVTEVPKAIQDGKIHQVFVFGENPMMSDPDSADIRESFAKLDLLVVQDMFMTETAQHADVVLPAVVWGEKDGTFTSTSRRIQRTRKAVEAPGECREDWWIFSQLAKRMGYDGMNYTKAEDIWNEIRETLPEYYGGISYARIEDTQALCWPCKDEKDPGTPILHVGGKFMTPNGKALLRPVLFQPDRLPEEEAKSLNLNDPILGKIAERPDATWPFNLSTGRRVSHYHTGTMTRKSYGLNAVAPEELIEVNPKDAAELGIVDRDYVRVETRRGHIVAKCWVTERVQPKNLFGTFHFWEACANELTNGHDLDPICGIPEFKCNAAKLRKASHEEWLAWMEHISAEAKLKKGDWGPYYGEEAAVNS